MKRHTDDEYREYKTIRQWAKQGYLPKEGAQGIELWANCNYQDSYTYYSPEEVETAATEQLAEFFAPERKRKNELAKKRRAKARAERESEKERKQQEKINEAVRPYLKRIAELKAIIQTLTNVKSDGTVGSKTLVIDTETTGLDPEHDELLQLSIIDSEGNTLFDSYFKPFASSWDKAQRIHGITPETVKNAPKISEELIEINSILSQAKKIIGYNVDFDINFLRNNGIIIYNDIEIEDVMFIFAEIYGDYNEYYNSFTWQKLTTAAEYYGYDWSSQPSGAHNSLSDCYATLYVHNKIYEKD